MNVHVNGLFMFWFGKKKTPEQLFYHTDLHSHLLPGIDDGSPDAATSVELLRYMQSWGVKRLCVTPHVVLGRFENTPESIGAAYRQLQQEMDRQGVEMEIHCSAEYRMDDNFHRILDAGGSELLPLPGNYLLVENSFSQPALDLDNLLFNLMLKGFQPILAHPERYHYYHSKKESYQHLHNAGCLFQVNLLSLAGHYGKAPKEVALWLCKNDMVDFLGSDLHHRDHAEAITEWLCTKEYRQLADRLENIRNDKIFT